MILCWVDAGPTFGLGHLARALALGEALTARGAAWRVALVPDPTALAWLRAAGARRPIALPERGPALAHVLDAARGAAAVVVDVQRPLGRPEVRALGGNRPILVVDNAGPGVADADLVLAPFATARDARWLAGAAHVPLRRAFRLAGDLRGPRGSHPVVVVSMGAMDPGGLTVPAVEGLAIVRGRGTRLSARVLANPTAPVWEKLPGLLRRLDFAPPRPVDPTGTVTHLAEADVAVLAMGVTVYEALACGVPTLVVCRNAGDVAHARALAARGAVVSLGREWSDETLARAVADLLADPGRRETMAAAGRALVDGRGAERVTERLLALVPNATEVRAHAASP
jgi:spore coat polysaccharide biosynthesis predicted glycosyltransferase SpsG